MNLQITDTPLISVLMPTYNVAEYVEEAVESILNQTYTNFELIVVDDGSADDTYQKLLAIAARDQRVRVFKNPVNSKIVKTLNFALAQAKGEYIARMDGDDVSVPERFEKQMQFLLNNPEVDLVGLNVIVINELGEEVKRVKYSGNPTNANTLVQYFSPVPHFWIAKKSTYEKVGDYRIATSEDYDFLLRMSSMNMKFCNLQEFLIKQRIRQGNTVSASGLVQRKLIDYCRELYFERLRTGKKEDSYSDEALEQKKKVGNIEKYFFNISNKFFYQFTLYVQSNKLKAAFYIGLAILFSPIHQGKFFYRKFKYNSLLQTT